MSIKDRKNIEQYISENINELSHEHKISVLQLVFNSSIRNKIKEKGNGVQIKYDDIDNDLLTKVYLFVVEKNCFV